MTDPHPLEEDVARLREAIDWILQQPALTGAPSTTAWRWADLDEAAARTAWTALTAWVDWLIGRYALDDVIPPCWYAHGAIVEELTALHLAWEGAYSSAQAHPAEPMHWHEQLERTQRRIREWDRHGCTSGRHQADDAPIAEDQDNAARAAAIEDDLTRRRRT